MAVILTLNAPYDITSSFSHMSIFDLYKPFLEETRVIFYLHFTNE